jgi:cobalamin biosynthesis protein CbiD
MRKLALATALAAATFAVPTIAQVSAPQINAPAGLIPVTVGNVILQDILTDVEINALNDLDLLNDNQIVVQVPVSVAANVCNVAVNVLASSKSKGEGCTATSGSDALAKVIRQRIKTAR